jgi:hypothetical protein
MWPCSNCVLLFMLPCSNCVLLFMLPCNCVLPFMLPCSNCVLLPVHVAMVCTEECSWASTRPRKSETTLHWTRVCVCMCVLWTGHWGLGLQTHVADNLTRDDRRMLIPPKSHVLFCWPLTSYFCLACRLLWKALWCQPSISIPPVCLDCGGFVFTAGFSVGFTAAVNLMLWCGRLTALRANVSPFP